jgi:hypothetical protein
MSTLGWILQKLHQSMTLACAVAVGWVASEMWRASRREIHHGAPKMPVIESIAEDEEESCEHEDMQEPSHALQYVMDNPDCTIKMVFGVRT